MSWQAEAETVLGRAVRIHEIDRANGFYHGYVDGDHIPKVWAIDNGQLLIGLRTEYNLNLATFQRLE